MGIPISAKGDYAKAKDMADRIFKTWSPPQFAGMPEIQYIERNLKVATEDDPPLIVPFRLNPVQKIYDAKKSAIEAPRTSGKRILTLKSRRMGITTYEQGVSYAKIKTQSGARCVTVAQSDDAVTTIFEMVKLFHKEDPNFIRPSRNNETMLAYASMRSKFSVSTAKGTAIKRGDTLHRVHGSEVAFWDINERAADNLIASLDKAANKGELVLESTANGPSGIFHHLWTEAQSGRDRWKGIFLGWYMDARNSIPIGSIERDHIIDTLDDDEIFLVNRCNCTPMQLAWRREQIGSTEKSKKIFKQEYPAIAEEAFIATGFCFFDLNIIEQRIKQCDDPIFESDELCIWKRPVEGHRYIVAADTSEGNSDSDPTPIVVLDWDTGEQVYRLNWCAKAHILGRKCVEIAKEYNGAIIAIEANNTGHSALNTVMNQEMYPNVYFHEDDVRNKPKFDQTPGFETNGKTKPILLGDLEDALEKNTMKVNDKLFLSQCRSFRDEGGTVKAARGAKHHGDLVIAWGITWQVRKSSQAIFEPIFV